MFVQNANGALHSGMDRGCHREFRRFHLLLLLWPATLGILLWPDIPGWQVRHTLPFNLLV